MLRFYKTKYDRKFLVSVLRITVANDIGNEMAEISFHGDFEERESKNSFSREAYPEI